MYVNLRRYPKLSTDKGTVHQSVRDDLLPRLREREGFKAYCAFWDEDGAGVSASVFEDQEAAHRSTDVARQWVMRHQDFFSERGEEFAGACIAHELSDGLAREAADGGGAAYVLIRELAGVPGTQDTRAFVQQRTLPVITRWPGFKAVYMARHDRDDTRAAVFTLFDTRDNAVACHGKAVELLREGLPRVSVARVVQGQSATLLVLG